MWHFYSFFFAAFLNANFFFDGILDGHVRGWAGDKSTPKVGQHAIHLGKRGCFVLTILCYLANICVQIRPALHKVTTQERSVGGGKEGGGILYLNKIYDTGFGVYTPKDQRSRRTTTITNYYDH